MLTTHKHNLIKTASQLLAAFIRAERMNVESIKMSHMPTLGAAYERIVSSGIDSRFVLSPGLALKVVSGFVKGLSNQIDCMLVRGDVPIDQVLCVLEVKKTLYKSEFRDGIAHLADIQRHFLRHFASESEGLGASALEQARISFSKITGRPAPSSATLDTVAVSDLMLSSTLTIGGSNTGTKTPYLSGILHTQKYVRLWRFCCSGLEGLQSASWEDIRSY